MGNAARKKQDYLHIRVASKDKRLIEKAAQATGLSVSAFVVSRTLEAAQGTIAPKELRLSNADRDLVLALLEAKPKKLPPKLADAFRLVSEK